MNTKERDFLKIAKILSNKARMKFRFFPVPFPRGRRSLARGGYGWRVGRVNIWFLDHVQGQEKVKESLRKGVYVCISLILFPLSLKWRALILEIWD